jgi:peptidoglycan/LPS O-acetylase OafA/YrhL
MTQTSTRDLTLDAWRALLILSVMAFHYTVRWAPPLAPVDSYGYASVYPPALELLKYAVHVFFVISGVVITMTLYRCKGPIDFAVRRFARLFPTYFVAASIIFVLTRIYLPDLSVSFVDYLKNLSMMAENLGARYVDGVFWSLAVEVKFYFWMAVSYWVLRDRFWIGAVVVAVAGMGLNRIWHGFADQVLIQPYISFFLWGIALRLVLFESKIWAGAVTALVGVCAYALNAGFISLDNGPSWAANLFVLATIALLVVTVVTRTLALPFLALLGRWSYALYLIHENIGLMVIRALKQVGASDVLAQLGAALTCISGSALLFYLIEQPAERMLRKAFARLQQSESIAGLRRRLQALLPQHRAKDVKPT